MKSRFSSFSLRTAPLLAAALLVPAASGSRTAPLPAAALLVPAASGSRTAPLLAAALLVPAASGSRTAPLPAAALLLPAAAAGEGFRTARAAVKADGAATPGRAAARAALAVPGPITPRAATADGEAAARAVEAWQALRFGMFVHFGPVSLKGTEIGWSRGAQVPVEEYDELYRKFDPVRFDADEWVSLAREAGMKYLVITSKHHDGFCLWDSKFTGYDITAAPFKRDILAELSAACRKQGILFCVYYSILDWHHPDYPTGSPGGRTKKPHPNMPRYFEYVKNQTREIIEKYGPIGVLWFDGQWEKPWTPEYGGALYDYLKALQPSLVINNRVSKVRRSAKGTALQDSRNAGDYDTPEQRIGGFNRERPWETCMTLCRQWAWKPGDTMKPLKECLRTLLRTVGGDGNLLFNVGPMPDGRIEPRQAERLREMGRWLKKYGRCVYGTRGGPFMPGRWGASTCRGDRIDLFVFEWPGGGPLPLPPIGTAIEKAENLSGGAVITAPAEGGGIALSVPQKDRDPIVTVIELTVAGKAFDIPPAPVFPLGRPIPVEKATASNVFKKKKEYGADKAVDGDEKTRWATDAGTREAFLEVDLGRPRRIAAAWISEAYPGRVRAFELRFLEKGEWVPFLSGEAIGEDREIRFEPITARRIRLVVTRAAEGPTIKEFKLFGP